MISISISTVPFPIVPAIPKSEVADRMLHVRMLSGEMVTSILAEEIHDVKSLKLRLNQLHGLPPRFRQRLLLSGVSLEDTPRTLKPCEPLKSQSPQPCKPDPKP